jgi:hypothetical protein
MDREADIFRLFAAWREQPSVQLLVRAKHNRRTTQARKLFDVVRSREPQLHLQLLISRQSARPKRSKQAARPARAERTAEVAVRYQQLELRPPDGDQAPVALWVIHVLEETPPPAVKPLEWFLLTTRELTTPEQARQCLEWYCLRWRIEDWHRVLKTGCRIEALRHETAERLQRAIAINAVIAWRIMLMTLLGRETPDLPAEVLFSDVELKVLAAFAKQRKLRAPHRLHDAVYVVGKMGGYMGRKNDPPPGHQLMWHGYTYLRILCIGYLLHEP